MTLIKKTAVLTNKGAEGYITIVRIGDEVGAKIVGESFDNNMLFGLRLGANPTQYARITGKKTEIGIKGVFHQNDSINCTIIKGDLLVAKSGTPITINSIKDYFNLTPESQKKTEITDIQDTPISQDITDDLSESSSLKDESNDLNTPSITTDIPIKEQAAAVLPTDDNATKVESSKAIDENNPSVVAKTMKKTAGNENPEEANLENNSENEGKLDILPDEPVAIDAKGSENDNKDVENETEVAKNEPEVAKNDKTINIPHEKENTKSDETTNVISEDKGKNIDKKTTKASKKHSDDLEKDFLSRLSAQANENFYPSIKEKLDELFVIHPTDESLNKAIPDSKWIKIYYDGDDYYVVGKLFDDDKIAYLSYGVPGIKSIAPPKLTKEICQWFGIPNMPAPYEGYYLIFQNAKNGQVEKAD